MEDFRFVNKTDIFVLVRITLIRSCMMRLRNSDKMSCWHTVVVQSSVQVCMNV